MYLHVGWNEIVLGKDILSVCDYRSWIESDINRSTLEMARVAGKVRRVGRSAGGDNSVADIRSVILCREELILSPITSSTLQKRARGIGIAAQPPSFRRVADGEHAFDGQ